MPLQIPKDEVPALAKILQLPDSSIDELIGALASSTIASIPKEMAARIAEHVPSIPIEDLDLVINALYSLYHVREFSEVAPSRFLNDLIEALRASDNAELAIKKEEIGHFKDRFRRLLSIGTLNMLSKAIGLQREGEKLFCEAKVLSDIRPVFSDNVEQRPVAAVVTHTLKMSYHERGDHKDFFIVLDSADVVGLQDLLSRALMKDDTLRKMLREFKVPDLGM